MTTFLMLAMALAGWLAFKHLPVSDIPAIDHPKIDINVSYAGTSPETMLNLVTIPLEKELTHVKGVQEMLSNTSTGSTHITLTFGLDKNIDDAVRDIQEALSRADHALPQELDSRPSYRKQTDGQDPIMYILLTSTTGDLGELRNYADGYILPRLNRIEGLAQVMCLGESNSLWVRINPEQMAARRIGFNQVVDTVKKLTAQAPLGSIHTSNRTISLELVGEVQHAKEIENAYISGTSVRIKDIGEVSSKASESRDFKYVTKDESSKALILAVQKISDGNTVAVSTAVKAGLEAIKKGMPKSMVMHLWFDKSVWIQESILDVEYSLLFAFILVVLVIYLTLGRASDALIPALALPLSLLGTFIAMYLLDYSLDILSLLALTLSVGFVVDDAIVVLENIVRKQEEGVPALEASLEGAKQICFTIVSMTLSLVAVFIPLLFMPGINGRLFREFSMTLAISILISGFVSLTLTPMLCSRFISHKGAPTKLQNLIHAFNASCVGIYKKCLLACISHPKKILLGALACAALTVPLFSKLSVNLLPPEDRGFVFVYAALPAGSSSKQITAYQESIQQLIQQDSNIENFVEFSMGSDLGFFVRLLPIEERAPQKSVIRSFQAGLNRIPGVQAFVQGYQLINLEFNLNGGSQYRINLQGTELAEVKNAADELIVALQKSSSLSSAHLGNKNDAPKLSVNINSDYAHRLGFNKQHVQELLQYAFGHASIGSIHKDANNQQIYMELAEGYHDRLNTLNKLFLTSSNGTLVPLAGIASWQEKIGAPNFRRRDQFPSLSINFSLTDSIAPQAGIQEVESIAAEILPKTVFSVLGGSAKAVSSAMSDMTLLLVAAAIVMYIVLGMLYESFIHPLTILSSLPFACLGGVLTLIIFNEPISIFSGVGFLLLIGIVKKNGIMMVDYALEAMKEGCNASEAIVQGCVARFRPIMMTTIAAIMGALPIAIGFGDGSEMRRGLGLVIVGGLLFSQLLTLFVTPLLFLAFERLRGGARGGGGAKAK